MKKFYAHYAEKMYKEEIIVYAKNKSEAYELVDDYSSNIDCDFGTEDIKIFNWPPKEKFDKDNTLIIHRNKVVEPALKPILSFTGEILNNLWPHEKDSQLAVLEEKDIKKLRKEIVDLIKTKLKK